MHPILPAWSACTRHAPHNANAFFNIPGRKSIMVAIIGLPEDENKAAWFIEKRHAIPDV
jgi:hypothetical protein